MPSDFTFLVAMNKLAPYRQCVIVSLNNGHRHINSVIFLAHGKWRGEGEREAGLMVK